MAAACASALMYLVAMLVTALPNVLMLLAFSQISPFCPAVVHTIANTPPLLGKAMFAALVLGAGAFAVSIKTIPPRLYWVCWSALLAFGVCTAVVMMARHPCSTVPSLVLVGPMLLHAVRRSVYVAVPIDAWCSVQSFATGVTAVALFVAWVAWIAMGFVGRARWFDWPPAFGRMVVDGTITWKLAFVLWASPVGNAAVLALLSTIYWVRWHYLCLVAEEERQKFFDFSLKRLLGWLVALAMLVWLGAAVSATEERKDMRDETVYMAFWTFVCLGVWVTATYGEEAFVAQADDSKALVEVWKILHNEWVKAFIVLLGALPIGIYMSTYACYRGWLRGLREGGQPAEWPLFGHLRRWHWPSVLAKATWIGLLYIVFFVILGKFILVALSMTNELIANMPVFIVSAIVFTIGFVIFMCPSSPAAPVYALMGVVIIQSADHHGWSYSAGLAWATAVTFAMKMSFAAAAQKWIGEPLGQRLWVRRCVCIHTPYMRAVEQILQEGMSVAKVAVLIGGPDWPVSVLCGILRLPLLPILVCLSPVLLQSVFPCVLSGTLLYYESMPADRSGGVPVVARYGLAEASLLLAVALQFGTGLVAFVCVQEVLEEDYERLSAPRLEDRELIELDEAEDRANQQMHAVTRWTKIPMSLRAALVVGVTCVEISLLLLHGPWYDLFGVACFRNFDLMTSVEEDLDGNPLAIVRPLGWAAFALAGLSSLGLISYHTYEHRLRAEIASGEAVPIAKAKT